MSYSVVWFKRDLRVHDHLPLVEAGRHGPVLCLYIVEPGLWAQPGYALQHYGFAQECIADLSGQLQRLGLELHIVAGEAVDVLQRLQERAPFARLFSHEETGNAYTYARDRAVAGWCRAQGIVWQEFAQHGVVRRLRSRDGWHACWQEHMQAPCVPAPPAGAVQPAPVSWSGASWPDATALGIAAHNAPLRQRGGRARGRDVLLDFLGSRSAGYRSGISSPLTAPQACSRLSPYLALGCLSMREVVQATQRRLQRLRQVPTDDDRRQGAGLSAFLSRLHWHCHFIQKLESEPELEYRNLHRAYDGLRECEWNAGHFAALTEGRTGWPMVDACVAMLRTTGWLNFRMRAMLVSVAAYPLWLHWRPVGEWLAQQFLDYEPGIHWSQMQMQAGTTGINTTRVYNPIKQAHDHDPHGHFVRHWLPAMRRVPDSWLFQPWLMPPDVQARCGVHVGDDIPVPLVDLEQATRRARQRLHALRAQPEVRAATAAIVEKHGSRRVRTARSPRKTVSTASAQQSLEF